MLVGSLPTVHTARRLREIIHLGARQRAPTSEAVRPIEAKNPHYYPTQPSLDFDSKRKCYIRGYILHSVEPQLLETTGHRFVNTSETHRWPHLGVSLHNAEWSM